MLDLGNRSVSFSQNGNDFGAAFPIPAHLQRAGFYAAICIKAASVRVVFQGATTPPAGFVWMGQASARDMVTSVGEGDEDDAAGATPACVILEPSRDLAEQTARCLVDYKKFMPAPTLQVMLAVGGTDIRDNIRALKAGAHVVVATPGRLEELVAGGKLSCAKVRHLVLDEADRLLETGNRPTIMNIFKRLRKDGTGDKRLQVLLFSATLHSPEIRELSEVLCQHPTWVDLKGRDYVPSTVHHLVVEVDPVADSSWGAMDAYPTDEVHLADKRAGKLGPSNPSPLSRSEGIKRLKLATLVKLVDKLSMEHAIIFCRTNLDCDNLERHLNALGGGRAFGGKAEKGRENPYSCVVLGSWRTMEQRRANLQHFKDGDVRFLICTDLGARGIDVVGLPFVVNVTLPDKPEDYIHRIGRVGRADRMGLAISLVATCKERVWFCQKSTKGRGPGGRAPPCDDTRDYDVGGNCIW